ncbi:CerR family C-terminal domain-containing protein [bacterium]|nr:CerR family C-terminal domain-containing protein [bacterium]
MSTQHNAAASTRDRVLESACKLFGEKGFRDATVQDICALADANIAAVNYYFRDKESLYLEAMRRAARMASEAFPIHGGLPKAAPAEQRLRAHVGAVVRRILSNGPPSYFTLMMVKEMAEPTAAHEVLMRELVGPLRDNMHGILNELLGENVDPKLRRMCALSTISQFLFLGFNRSCRESMFRADAQAPAPSMDELTDHMTRFALAGIHAARKAAAKEEAS